MFSILYPLLFRKRLPCLISRYGSIETKDLKPPKRHAHGVRRQKVRAQGMRKVSLKLTVLILPHFTHWYRACSGFWRTGITVPVRTVKNCEVYEDLKCLNLTGIVLVLFQ